jgi:hypothetical protein
MSDTGDIKGGPYDGADWAGHNVTPEEARRMADEAFDRLRELGGLDALDWQDGQP